MFAQENLVISTMTLSHTSSQYDAIQASCAAR